MVRSRALARRLENHGASSFETREDALLRMTDYRRFPVIASEAKQSTTAEKGWIASSLRSSQ
jgi:hypothetical protein